MSIGKTVVSIRGEDWLINGELTHAGREFRGHRIEGLLLNSRMANGVFDDANELTRCLWAYPDTGEWDPERNTDELIAQLPAYRAHGLDAICVNIQGASPLGYYRSENRDELIRRIREHHPDATEDEIWAGLPGVESQPWNSGGLSRVGFLKPRFARRLERVIEACDALGMVVVLGLFYFGQDERIDDENSVRRAVDDACKWLQSTGFTNVVVEINNEADVQRYEHEILTPPKVYELVSHAASRRVLAGTSFARLMLPTGPVVDRSDFILLHGNGIHNPADLAKRIEAVRAMPEYRGQPVVINEDDHFDFDKPENNFMAAISRHAGWGYFDPGPGAGGSSAYGDYVEGYQNPPVNWSINSPRKRAFFDFLAEVTGSSPKSLPPWGKPRKGGLP